MLLPGLSVPGLGARGERLMRAVCCPVCLGTGKYEDRQCHGCNGKGWVVVREDWRVAPAPRPASAWLGPFPYPPIGRGTA